MSNSGVKMLKGLQFGMLDEDNDGEVSLSDISKAVFRRAGDRDLSRIRRFLEVRSCLRKWHLDIRVSAQIDGLTLAKNENVARHHVPNSKAFSSILGSYAQEPSLPCRLLPC